MWVLSWCREERYFLQLEKPRGKRGRSLWKKQQKTHIFPCPDLSVTLSWKCSDVLQFLVLLIFSSWFTDRALSLSSFILNSSPRRTKSLMFCERNSPPEWFSGLDGQLCSTTLIKLFFCICYYYWTFAWSPFLLQIMETFWVEQSYLYRLIDGKYILYTDLPFPDNWVGSRGYGRREEESINPSVGDFYLFCFLLLASYSLCYLGEWVLPGVGDPVVRDRLCRYPGSSFILGVFVQEYVPCWPQGWAERQVQCKEARCVLSSLCLKRWHPHFFSPAFF